MAKLLTLALAETRGQRREYALVAWNLDGNSWVRLHVPMDEFHDAHGNPLWDIFGITEAEVVHVDGERPEVHQLVPDTQPRYVGSLRGTEQRLKLLESLAVSSLRKDVYQGPDWVGLVRIQKVGLLYVRRRSNPPSDEEHSPFNWECRIPFQDASGEDWSRTSRSKPGAPCKDLRWKAYWARQEATEERVAHWQDHLNANRSYFLIEIYPPLPGMPGAFNDGLGHYFGIVGVLCLPA